MDKYGPETFGKLNAADYDRLHNPGTTDEAVALLAELFAGQRVLELAIGSGRIALPLALQGIDIHGIDASTEMVAKLREKHRGETIPVTIGDMATVQAAGLAESRFDAVFLVFNTLFNLTTQHQQVECFRNAAAHLKPSGLFLLETFIPTPSWLMDDLRVLNIDFDSVQVEAVKHDPVNQVVEFQRIQITPKGTQLTPFPMRYALPPEIDLMAKLAGFQLKHRWGSWQRARFTAESRIHVSVYEYQP